MAGRYRRTVSRSNSRDSQGSDMNGDEEMVQASESGGSMSQDTTTLLGESSTSTSTRHGVPVGAWRDGLWDIGRHGWCHGSLWTACCCIPLAIGQIMTRLQLDFGGFGTSKQSSFTYTTLVLAVISYWITRILMFLLIALFDPNADDDVKEWIEPGPIYYTLCAIDDLFSLAYLAATFWMLRRVRQQVRRMYAIPDKYCSYEDTCCSLVCPCFVAGQLLRHTADYEHYPSRFCFTASGLPANAPSIV